MQSGFQSESQAQFDVRQLSSRLTVQTKLAIQNIGVSFLPSINLMPNLRAHNDLMNSPYKYFHTST